MSKSPQGEGESGISSLGPRPPEQELREHLAAALSKAGYSDVCREEDRPQIPTVNPAWTGIALSVCMVLAICLSAKHVLDLGGFGTAFTALIAFIVVMAIGTRSAKAVGLLMLSWVALGGCIWLFEGSNTFLNSYGVAIVAGISLFLLLRISKGGLGVDLNAFFRSFPLLFPLVLLLLFAPLVTADFWEVASSLGASRLIALGAIILVPLTLVLIRRLVLSLPGVVAELGNSLAEDPNTADSVHSLVGHLSDDNYAESWVLNNGREMLQLGFDRQTAHEYSPYLAITVRKPLTRSLMGRTAAMLAGLGGCVFIYLYVLSTVLVPSGIAKEWGQVSALDISATVLGVHVALPSQPYLATTALLSIVALGAFLALLTVEESYSRAMAGALLHEPVREFLMLSLPYTRLRERAILGEAPIDQVGPFAQPDEPSGV